MCYELRELDTSGPFSIVYKRDNFCNFLFAFMHTLYHYENMPIQIYWKFYHQKMKIFR